jgi:putative addiction module killer protein
LLVSVVCRLTPLFTQRVALLAEQLGEFPRPLAHRQPEIAPIIYTSGAVIYSSQMIEVRQTAVFREWLDGMADRRAAARIAQRIVRLQAGLLGDAKSVGDGLMELRVDAGPGYRVYFLQRGRVLIILLCGGDKKSQRRDIDRAKALAEDLED